MAENSRMVVVSTTDIDHNGEHIEALIPVRVSFKTMKEAAVDLARKTGWKPGDNFSFHSATELMAEFGMSVDRGEIGCDYPNCGCCADAACGDAVDHHPDLGGIPVSKETVEAFQSRYRQIAQANNWGESWPSEEASVELIRSVLRGGPSSAKLLEVAQRLIKWDIDFPVNADNGYVGLQELNALIADAKAAVHAYGASYESDFGPVPPPTKASEGRS